MSPDRLPHRHIGTLRVSALGLGCMGMTLAYGRGDRRRSLTTLHHALDRGVNLLDTADMYGRGRNERLLSEVLAHRRAEVVIATKVGIITQRVTGLPRGVDGSPAYIRNATDASLRRLGVAEIDLLYLHRVDPTVPIEDAIGAMADLVGVGKVREIGLSEASGSTLRRAAVVHPIAALQSEWSIFSRDIESGAVPAARDVGTALVAYSPLGRGMLTGSARRRLRLLDFRRSLPRWNKANRAHNLTVVDTITTHATQLGMTTAQLALAWLLAQGDDVIPIPGTTHPETLDENLAAIDATLPADVLEKLARLHANGYRYKDMNDVRGESPTHP